MNWYGGKPAGCLYKHDTYCQVTFTKSSGIKSKTFNYKKFPSHTQAIAAAEIWQKQTSDENGLTKNMYRTVQFGDELYLEVLLQNNHIMMCDLKHLPIVEERIWYAYKSVDKYVYYVKSRDSKKRQQKAKLFHSRVFPNYTQIDHINRNGLDNRFVNIREGRGRINANNKRMQKNNTSGTKGVFYEGGSKPRWRAQLNNESGKKCSKSFAVSKWGDDSYNLACEWREKEMMKVTKYLTQSKQ